MRAGKLGFKCSLGLASTEGSEMSAGLWGRIEMKHDGTEDEEAQWTMS